jgi:hypothetical protein
MTAAGRITPPVGIRPRGAHLPGVHHRCTRRCVRGRDAAARRDRPTLGRRAATTLSVAAFLLVSGIALAVAGVTEVVRHQTTIVPHHAVSALVTTGPYRITRNPIYTGLAIAYLGVHCYRLLVACGDLAVRPCWRRPRCYRPRAAIPGQPVRSAVLQLPGTGAALALASTQHLMSGPSAMLRRLHLGDQPGPHTHQVRADRFGSRLGPAAVQESRREHATEPKQCRRADPADTRSLRRRQPLHRR